MTEPRDDRLDRLDAIDLAQFPDYESEEFEEGDGEEEDGRNDYVSAMWDRYGFDEVRAGRGFSEDLARAVVIAHQLCQTYVDTFSTEYDRFRVVFDPTLSTAGTDLAGRVVAITPAPIYDKTLTPQQAGVILTAMATHEVSHVRYGTSTRAAVRRVFGNKRAPNILSNLLDDVRIERRFADDYPGYRDVFRPMVDYVGRAGAERVPPPHMGDLVSLAVRAVRFGHLERWEDAEVRAERDWWRAWAERHAKQDAPRRHVEAVREALKHIVTVQQIIRRKREEAAMKFDMSLPDNVRRMRDGIGSLSPLAQKAARMMSEGRTGPEIAATLGLSTDDAKILTRSVRKKLVNATSIAVGVQGASEALRKLGLA